MEHEFSSVPAVDDVLIGRWIDGEVTPVERHAVEAWLSAVPGRQAEVTALHNVLGTISGTIHAPLAERETREWARQIVQASVASTTAPATATATATALSTAAARTRRRTSSRIGLWMAGAVAAAALAAFPAWRFVTAPSTTVTTQTYTTTAGQCATVTLADGSRAVLGPATTLDVHTSAREGVTVRVQGEALFTVTHDPATPFTVQTERAVARVLGTEFVVRRYPNEGVTRVVVTEGRVAVQPVASAAAQTVLTANMLAVVEDSGSVRVTPSIATSDYTGWTTGVLVFRDRRAADVLADIGRAYGAEIKLADTALANRLLTWTVRPTRNTLAEVMAELPMLLDVHVVQSGQTILVVPGRRASKKSTDLPSSLPELQHGR